MVILHGNFFIDFYLNWIKKIHPQLHYNYKVFAIFGVLFLLVSIALSVSDIIYINSDLNTRKTTEYKLMLGLAIFFDILKLYYMYIDAYLMVILMGLTSIGLTSTVLYYIENLNRTQEDVKIRTVAEIVIIFLILSLISSTIYHYPTFKQIFV